MVWACGLAEEEWVDSGDAVGSCAPCFYPEDAFICCLTRRCSAVAAGVRLTETTRERKKDYKFKLRTWGVLVGVITCVDSECFIHLFYFLYLKYIFVHKFLQCYIELA